MKRIQRVRIKNIFREFSNLFWALLLNKICGCSLPICHQRSHDPLLGCDFLIFKNGSKESKTWNRADHGDQTIFLDLSLLFVTFFSVELPFCSSRNGHWVLAKSLQLSVQLPAYWYHCDLILVWDASLTSFNFLAYLSACDHLTPGSNSKNTLG